MTDVISADLQFEDNDTLKPILLTNVYWGYLNAWRIVRDGKRVKNETWQTYWVDLSGPTIRLHRDTSLAVDSGQSAPPSSTDAPDEENLRKAAFFNLGGAVVEILADEELHPKKVKQPDLMRVYRRHIFKISLPKVNAAYVFQASSRSSLLRWVSKLQEAVDNSQENEVTANAEYQLQRAKTFMRKSRSHEEIMPLKKSVEFGSAETLLKEKKVTQEQYGRIKEIKLLLQEKYDFLKQLERQEKDFLGGKEAQEVTGEPFEGTLDLDYCLIPGRLETYIPKGTKVSLQGQLPDKRWRCYIEKSQVENIDLIQCLKRRQSNTKTLPLNWLTVEPGIANSLCLGRCDSNASTCSRQRSDSDASNASKGTTCSETSISESLNTSSYDGTYPLIGSVPTSALEELKPDIPENKAPQQNVDFNMTLGTPPSSPSLDRDDSLRIPSEDELPAAPYSPHKRNLSSSSRNSYSPMVKRTSPHLIHENLEKRKSTNINNNFIINNNNIKQSTAMPKEGHNPFQNLPNRLALSKVDKQGVIESLSSDEENDACELSDEGLFWTERGSSIRQKIQQRTQSFRKDIQNLNIQHRTLSSAVREREFERKNSSSAKNTIGPDRNAEITTIPETLFSSDQEGLFENPARKVSKTEEKTEILEKPLLENTTPKSDRFVIKGKLHQRGISIIIGDSSSSEEEENEEEAPDDSKSDTPVVEENTSNKTDEVFQKILKSPSDEGVLEDHNSNELHLEGEINESLSDITISSHQSSEDGIGRVTSGFDLVSEYSQNETEDSSELEIERPRSIGHSFGFELPPPKNTRRKLKLIKQPSKGFGFRLTTYSFSKEGGQTERSNFVSYVEDDGPAYLAGLKPGDIILEIGGNAVADIDHKELTALVTEFETEMIVVVKFTNEGKRNELLVEVGNRQSKLRQMMSEYDRICVMERSVRKDGLSQNNPENDQASDESSINDDLIADFQKDIQTLYKEVVIWTSKFQKGNSEVLHSIQEIIFDGQTTKSRRENTGLTSTTSCDLLFMYSSAAGLNNLDIKNLGGDIDEIVAASIKSHSSSSLEDLKKQDDNKSRSLDDRTFKTTGLTVESRDTHGKSLPGHVQLRHKKTNSPRCIERSKRHQSYKLAVEPGSLDLQAQEANIDYI